MAFVDQETTIAGRACKPLVAMFSSASSREKPRLQHILLPDVVADMVDLTQSPMASPDGSAGANMVGRPVIKIFKDQQSQKKRPFSRVVCEELFHKGKRHYKVKYNDGDYDDVTLDELSKIVVAESE